MMVLFTLQEYFNITNPVRGEVVLLKTLDYEQYQNMTFQVKARVSVHFTAVTSECRLFSASRRFVLII